MVQHLMEQLMLLQAPVNVDGTIAGTFYIRCNPLISDPIYAPPLKRDSGCFFANGTNSMLQYVQLLGATFCTCYQ